MSEITPILTRTGELLDQIIATFERRTPTQSETIVWYNNDMLSSFNIEGELGSESIPDKENAVKVDIGTAVTSIGNYAFDYCSRLTSITIPDSVTSIGRTAFGFCSGLTSITIPDSVTIIGEWAFSGCLWLSSITCQATTAPTVQSNTFGYNNPLYYTGGNTHSTGNNVLKVPQGSTGYDTGAWLDPLCNADKCGFHIEYLTPPVPPTPTAKTIAHYQDGSISELNISGKLNSSDIPNKENLIAIEINGPTTIGYGAFSTEQEYTSLLSSVTIGDTVSTIEGCAFEYCEALTSITIPSTVTSIGGGAFSGTGLTTISIPGSVSTIEAALFSDTNMTSVILESGVTTIEYNAFDNCIIDSLTIPSSAVNIDPYYLGGSGNATNVTFVGRSIEDVCSLFGIVLDEEASVGVGEYLHCTDGTLYNGGSDGYFIINS